MDFSFDIIIPCYNTNIVCFKKCVNSVLNQTYKNFRLIIVNDGSEDYKIDEYITSLNLTKIIYKRTDNCGSGSARNTGMEFLKSDYFLFLDSDDYLSIDCLKKINDYLQCRNVNLIQFGFSVENNGNFTKYVCPKEYINVKEIFNFNELIYKNWVNSTVWNKCYKTSEYVNMRFKSDLTLGEDRVFLTEIFLNKSFDKIYFLNESLYFYYINSNSLTRKYSQKSIDKTLLYFSYFLNLFKNNENTINYSFYISSLCDDILKIYEFFLCEMSIKKMKENQNFIDFATNANVKIVLKKANTRHLSLSQRLAWFLFKNRLFTIYKFLFIIVKRKIKNFLNV